MDRYEVNTAATPDALEEKINRADEQGFQLHSWLWNEYFSQYVMVFERKKAPAASRKKKA